MIALAAAAATLWLGKNTNVFTVSHTSPPALTSIHPLRSIAFTQECLLSGRVQSQVVFAGMPVPQSALPRCGICLGS